MRVERSSRRSARLEPAVPAWAGWRVLAGALLGSALLAAALARFPVLGLVALVLLVAAAVPAGGGAVARLVVGGVVAVGATAVLALVPWALRVDVNGVLLLAAVGGLALACTLADGGRGVRVLRPRPADAVLLVAFGSVATVLMRARAGRTPGGRLAVMLSGEDNAAHLAIVQASRVTGGYLYGGHDTYLSEDLQSYPQGVHVALGTVARALGGTATAQQSVTVYTLGLLLGVALLTGSLAWAGLRLAASCGADDRYGAVAGAVGIVAVTGPLLAMLQNGFFSQIWSYVFLACLIGVSVDPELARRPRWQVGLAGLLTAGVCLTFYLVLPVAALCLVAVLWCRRDDVLGDLRAHVAVAVAWLSAGAVPVIVSALSGAGGELNAFGPIFPLERALLVTALALAAVLVVVVVAQGTTTDALGWVTAFAAALAFVLALRQFQLATTGTTGYYYEKTLYSAQVVALPGIAALAQLLLSRALAGVRTPGRTAAAVSALALVGTAAHVLLEPRAPFLVHQLMAGKSHAAFDAALGVLPQDRRDPVLLWGYDTPVQDYVGNRMLGGVYHQDDQARRDLVILGAKVGADPAPLAAYLTSHVPATVLTRSVTLEAELRRLLSREVAARVHVAVLAP